MPLSFGNAPYGQQASVNAVATALAAAQQALTTSNSTSGQLTNLQASLASTTTVANQAETQVTSLTTTVSGLSANSATKGLNVYTGTQENTIVDKGTVNSGTVTFDFGAGNSQKLTVGGPLTIAFTDYPAAGIAAEMKVDVVNGGSALITFPSNVYFKDPVTGANDSSFTSYLTALGRNPASLLVSGTDTLQFRTIDGGVTVQCKLIL